MKDLLALLAHLLTTVAKLVGPRGARALIANSFRMKQQLLVISRSRRPFPPRGKANVRIMDVEGMETVPYSPLSRSFAERPVGTTARAYLHQVFSWDAVDTV